MIKTAIVNVVATAVLNQELDLDELGEYKEILHDSEIYGGRVAYFKSFNMEGKVSIFASGKMISVGTTSEEKAFSELEQAKEFLIGKRVVAKPVMLLPKMRNIVVVVNFGTNADLEELSKNCKLIYEPEQFPGGILRIQEPYKATILIFASGKAVITGLKSTTQIEPIVQRLTEILNLPNNSNIFPF